MSGRMGEAAVRWALNQTRWHTGMCQNFTRNAFEVGPGFSSAIQAWNGADHRHPVSNPMMIPRGVPVYWSGGSRGYGHASVSLGGGLVRSTDWPGAYRVGTARITDISRSWNMHLLGWTEDINGVRVWEQPPPVWDASNIAHATRQRLQVPNGKAIKKALAAEVGVGNMSMNNSTLGKGFREQYRQFQERELRKRGVRVTQDNADGIPGLVTLAILARRHGARVRA